MEPPMGLLRTGNGDTKARLRSDHHVPVEGVAAEAPLASLGALGQADWLWAHPEHGALVEAYGESDRREGPLHSVLTGLTMPAGLPEGMPGPWFGAAAFDGSLGPDWNGFAPVRFSQPALLAWRTGGRQFLAAFGDRAQARLDDARRRLDGPVNGVHFSNSQVNGVHPARRVRRAGERARWDGLVARALDAIASGSLDKVVLARTLSVECE